MYYPTLQNNQGMAQKVKKAQQRDSIPQVSVKLVKLPVSWWSDTSGLK